MKKEFLNLTTPAYPKLGIEKSTDFEDIQLSELVSKYISKDIAEELDNEELPQTLGGFFMCTNYCRNYTKFQKISGLSDDQIKLIDKFITEEFQEIVYSI